MIDIGSSPTAAAFAPLKSSSSIERVHDQKTTTTKRFFAKKTPRTPKSSSTITKTATKTKEVDESDGCRNATTNSKKLQAEDRKTSENTIEKDITINGVATTLTVTTKCIAPESKGISQSIPVSDIIHKKKQIRPISGSTLQGEIKSRDSPVVSTKQTLTKQRETRFDPPADGNPKTFFKPRKSTKTERSSSASKENLPKSPCKRKSPAVEKPPLKSLANAISNDEQPRTNPTVVKKKKKKLLSKAQMLMSQENLIDPPLSTKGTDKIIFSARLTQ